MKNNMKQTAFRIHFGDSKIDEYAFSICDATILACAKRISKGLHTNVAFVEEYMENAKEWQEVYSKSRLTLIEY